MRFEAKKGVFGDGGWVQVGLLKWVWLVMTDHVVRIKFKERVWPQDCNED